MVNLNTVLSLLPMEFNWKWAIGILVTLFVAVVVGNYFLKPSAVPLPTELPVVPQEPVQEQVQQEQPQEQEQEQEQTEPQPEAEQS